MSTATKHAIHKIKPEKPLKDVMDGCIEWRIDMPPHGHVSLLDVLGRLQPEGKTPDSRIAQAARVSVVSQNFAFKKPEDQFIRFLAQSNHMTPFEKEVVLLEVRGPKFMAFQWMRHRAGSFNEESGRYGVLKEEFYLPTRDQVRKQSKMNKQGSGDPLSEEDLEYFFQHMEESIQKASQEYQEFIKRGIANETSRLLLPINIFTTFWWKVDLRNLYGFLQLRMDEAAQYTIREYAHAVFQLIQEVFPISSQCFIDFQKESVTLSRLEVEAIRAKRPKLDDSVDASENRRYQEKLKSLSLTFEDEKSS